MSKPDHIHNITVLVSGRGTTLENLIECCHSGKISGRIVCVISNNAKAKALKIAEQAGIPSFAVGESDRIFEIAGLLETDLMLLAGYTSLLKVPPHYENRILNIHPSLLPKHGGKGYYGLNVHKAVLKSGDGATGATVHIVDNVYDNGTILEQQQIFVWKDKNPTPEELQARVQKVERELYPRAIQKFLDGKYKVKLGEKL